MHNPNPSPLTPPLDFSTTTTKPIVVAFTTPSNYANRLSNLITLKNFKPLWIPTITIQSTPQTTYSLKPYLQNLDQFSAIAFTSRTAISAFHDTLIKNTDIADHPLSPIGEIFTIAALGNDSLLLDGDFLRLVCRNTERIRLLVPQLASPSGLVEELGLGFGRRILCPVPIVVGIEEPPVVPDFLSDLGRKGWLAVRVHAYETRWAGPECVRRLVEEEVVDAIVFTSTGEVEGLLKSLSEFGFSWEMVRKMRPRLVVAAHGPVTAAGAERLGVGVDLVSSRFDSFDGVVDALELKLHGLQ